MTNPILVQEQDVQSILSAVESYRGDLERAFEPVNAEKLRYALERLDAGDVTIRPMIEWLPDGDYHGDSSTLFFAYSTGMWAGRFKVDMTQSSEWVRARQAFDELKATYLAEYERIIDAYQ